MDDEDDPVVEEIDVYLSKTLSDSLYVLQYPTRPVTQTYDTNDIIGARVKPKQQRVEIDIAIDKKYNRGMKDPWSSPTKDGDSTIRDKDVLTSSKVLPLGGCYAVGIFRKGNLHITPVSSILQMRHSFNYLDKNTAAENDGQDEKADETPEAQAVTVKFAGSNTERIKKIREKSYHYLQEKKENEPWLHSGFHSAESYESTKEIEKLFCPTMGSEVSSVPMTIKNRLHSVVPVVLANSEYCVSENAESLVEIHTLPAAEQIRALFLNAYVLRFEQILDLLDEEPTNLLRNLQQFAILVQGCWVVKSDILYNNIICSPTTGISTDILMRARDYILWMFTKSRFVCRIDVQSVVKIPDEDIFDLLSQLSRKAHHKGWEFKYPYDEEFVNSHPTVIQRQDMLWDVRYKQLVRDLRLGQMTSSDTSPRKSFPPPPSPRERKHFKYRESISDDTEESGAESSSNDKMDFEYSQSKGKFLKRIPTSPRKRSASGSGKNQLRFCQQPVSVCDISPKFLSVLPSVDVKTDLLTHIKDLLYESCCLTLSEAIDSLRDTSLNWILRREDCDSLMEETLLEAGACKLKNKWPQNAPPVPLYAFTKFGNTIDRYRNKLLELFTNTARSRPNFLLKKIEDELGEIVSESVCKQVFEEYCTYKSGFYYLKGTVCPDVQ